MKVLQVLNQADTIHVGMDVLEAKRVYSLYYGLTTQYCEPAIFKGDNGKYYSLIPRAVLIELTEEEIQKELSALSKCSDPSCGGHIILSLGENEQEESICDVCGAVVEH